MELHEITHAAADYIATVGWWRGPSIPREGDPVCMVMAVGDVCLKLHRGDMTLATARKYEALRALGFVGTHDAVDWNDAPERTKDEVIARLRSLGA